MEEIIESGNSAIDTIKLAIKELEGLTEFNDVIGYLESDIEEIERIVEPYQERQNKDWKEEKEEQLSQYYRDTF